MSKTGGVPSETTESLYTKNRKILEHFRKALNDVNHDYQLTCDKLLIWLADDRAFYEAVQPLVSERSSSRSRSVPITTCFIFQIVDCLEVCSSSIL